MSTTIGELKTQISEKFSIQFGEDAYRLYSSDVGYPNYDLEDDTKTLEEYKFEEDYTVYVEKEKWDTQNGIYLFELKVTGGIGAQ